MKPLRPFPFPINIGTDICQISRIYWLLNSPRAVRFVNRILAPEEQAWNDLRLKVLNRFPQAFHQYEDSKSTLNEKCSPSEELAAQHPDLWNVATFIAGRFAAKEAAIKAHSQRHLTFHDVIIERRQMNGKARLGSGPPVARIKGKTEADEDVSAMVSISHDGDYATAVCMAWDPSVTESQSGHEP